MRSVVNRNVVMRRIPVIGLRYEAVGNSKVHGSLSKYTEVIRFSFVLQAQWSCTAQVRSTMNVEIAAIPGRFNSPPHPPPMKLPANGSVVGPEPVVSSATLDIT